MTLIDSLDKTARPPELREEMWAQYPNAKQAQVRVGGDFPFLSSAEEVNLYIEVHLRRVGVGVNVPTLVVESGGEDTEGGDAEGGDGEGVGEGKEAPPPRPKGPPPKILNPKPTKPLFQD